MPTYNVSVVVDPSSAEAGARVVENNLNRVETKATGVRAALQRAFDFNAGSTVQTTSAVDRALDGVKSSADAAATSVDRAGKAIGILSAPSLAAANNLRQVNDNLVRLGITSQTIPAVNQRVVNSQAQVRQSTLSLGQQFNDFSTQVLAGGSVITAFAQQSGQAAFALQGFNGVLGRVGSFLAGPWGTILIIAATVLAGFATKLFDQNNALEDSVKKLKDDARETEIDRQAKEVFSNTVDGVTEALRRNRGALDDLEEGHKTAARRALEEALNQEQRLKRIRDETSAYLDQARALIELNRERSRVAGQDPRITGSLNAESDSARSRIDELEANLKKTDEAIAEAQRQREEALSRRVVELNQRDAVQKIKDDYDRQIEAARRRAVAEGTVNTTLAQQIRLLQQRRDAEVKAQQDRERTSNRGDGVSRFRSPEQAIGVAGRELQRQGLRVDGNTQFGVTTGHANDAQHNRDSIDVNVGRGVTEANVPDLRKRFDELALRYQARGYRVIWNGRVYEPGGSGPSGTAKGHSDHLHITAPRTIVGKPTQSSTEQQAITEFQRQQREAEQQADYVAGVVSGANARGRNENRATALEATINRNIEEFQRRFNRPANDNERGAITKALTDADAREIAINFENAYVKPLERLQALQGKVGLDRQVLNAQLEETERLGRKLTPVEEKQIENGIRRGDALQREAQILEQVKGPIEAYKANLEALNELLARGEINQTQFNSRVAELGASARDILTNMPGIDPKTGRAYSDIGAQENEDARYAKELETIQSQREILLQMGIDYDALVEAARKKHVDNLNKIDEQRKLVAIQSAQSIGENLLSITENTIGKQNAVYKALFVATKAFAIAEAIINIQRGVAQAAALPFPANLPAIASVVAATASIVSNIQSVALNLADGGYVSGRGGSRSDSIPANLSNGEFVVNAQATRSNRALLEAINSGRPVRAARERVAANDPGSPRPFNLRIDASEAPGVDWEVNRLSEDDVEVIARRVVARDAGKVVAAQLRDPNSRPSKAIAGTTTARRKRG